MKLVTFIKKVLKKTAVGMFHYAGHFTLKQCTFCKLLMKFYWFVFFSVCTFSMRS